MRMYTVYRGGTIVTVYGNHLDSVAVPRITITVVVSRINNDTNSTSSISNTDSEVVHTLFLCSVPPQRACMATRSGQNIHDSEKFTWSISQNQTRMWANAQRDGRPAEHRWRPLFDAAVWLTLTT